MSIFNGYIYSRLRSALTVLLLVTITATVFTVSSKAATVDTVVTYSTAMRKNIKAVVVLPASYSTAKKWPVLYMLHGYAGNYSNWVNNVPEVKAAADWYQMIIVCADGGFSSWYLDSKENPGSQYETYISKELVNFTDRRYSTLPTAQGRAITGLSMGGYGALSLAIKHPDIYGAAGSTSGGVDVSPFKGHWALEKVFGKYDSVAWHNQSVEALSTNLQPGTLALIFDCGSEDFFSPVNERLHQVFLARKLPHTYISRPGTHNVTYWADAISYQFIFFAKYFGTYNAAKLTSLSGS